MVWPVVGAAISAYGQYRANKETKNYLTGMSNTGYQRAMADMRAAGLNPILAGKLGPASTPNYTAQNIGSAFTQGYSQASSAKQAQAAAGLSKEQAVEVRTKVLKVIPATVEKLRQEGLLTQAKISTEEARTIFQDLTNMLTRMDVKALEKMGLSPMQIQYKPSNQIGSMLIDGMLKMPDKLVEASSIGYQKTKVFLAEMLDWAYKNKFLDRQTYTAQMNNLMRRK